MYVSGCLSALYALQTHSKTPKSRLRGTYKIQSRFPYSATSPQFHYGDDDDNKHKHKHNTTTTANTSS